MEVPMTREEIKAIRAKLGLSAPKMARLMRICVRTVFSYESGRTVVPGCTSAYLDLLMTEPVALAAAFKMAGLDEPRVKIRSHSPAKPIWTLASARRI